MPEKCGHPSRASSAIGRGEDHEAQAQGSLHPVANFRLGLVPRTTKQQEARIIFRAPASRPSCVFSKHIRPGSVEFAARRENFRIPARIEERLGEIAAGAQ